MKKKEYRDSFVKAHLSDTVAAQISMLREKNGWTQQQLAEKSDMRQSRISHLEDPNYGNLEIETLRKLASSFDVALTVRFVPFSELARFSATMSPNSLAIANFDEDSAPQASPLERPLSIVGAPASAEDGHEIISSNIDD